MQAKFKWLFLPPAIALVLFLGPLQSKPSTTTAETGNDSAATSEKTRIPALPDVWQVTSTLVGVLLLGAVAIAVIKRSRMQRPIADGEFMVLRQSLRLSQRHSIHAVEFDGQVLLVGECEGNVHVLQNGALPAATEDELEVSRRFIDDDDPDDGAVPRDMIIPRPEEPARRQPTAPTTSRRSSPQVAAKLANFKNLLARAGAGAEQ